jgi:DNA (cytosine-5)-methyltransferase 1
MPKFLELFAGAGGMTMGFEAAGWECVGHAEIEPHARAVLRHQWPDVPLHGDVAQLDGTTLPHFDLLTFGAPCQDLSIAGKRAGMTEGSGTRSSLFFEAIRIWKESSAPLALYENVLGAYSSNDGKDFAAVLSAFVGAAVPVPADGWRGAGVAAGPAGIAAWRTLDLQHFGWDGDTTPQRRRRVFVLGTRTGEYDTAEVLLVADGLLGNLAASQEAGEGTAEDAPAGPHGPSLPTGFSTTGSVGYVHDIMPSLPHLTGLNCPGAQMMGVLTYEWHNQDSRIKPVDVASSLNLNAEGREGHIVLPLTPQAVILRNREGKPGGGKGPLVSAERSLTLGTSNDQVVFTKTQYGAYDEAPSVDATLGARDHASLNTDLALGVGIPRRLMPIECERLMGWPDHHTAMGTDEQGRDYALSDTARYKLCGNGVGSPVTAWIGMRLKAALDTQ